MRGYQRGIWLQEIEAIRAVRSDGKRFHTSGSVLCGSGRGSGRIVKTVIAAHLLDSRDALRPRFAGLFALDGQRAQGRPGARCTRGLVCNVHKKCAHEHTGQRRASDIPCAMALRLITCSPRRTALLPPLRPERQLPPGALTPAPRRQDHTSSPYASAPSSRTSASTASPSHVRDDRDTPLLSGRDGDRYAPVRPSDKAKYFLFRGLTRFPKIGIDLPVGPTCRARSRHNQFGSSGRGQFLRAGPSKDGAQVEKPGERRGAWSAGRSGAHEGSGYCIVAFTVMTDLPEPYGPFPTP